MNQHNKPLFAITYTLPPHHTDHTLHEEVDETTIKCRNYVEERGYQLMSEFFNLNTEPEKPLHEFMSQEAELVLQLILSGFDMHTDKKFVFVTTNISMISKDKEFASSYLQELNKRGVSIEFTDTNITAS